MGSTKSAFEAISDSTRRSILDHLLIAGSSRAGDLAKLFPHITRPAVSKHLRILRSANLVKQRKKGREIWYEIDPFPLSTVQHWLSNYESFWLQKMAELKKIAETLE